MDIKYKIGDKVVCINNQFYESVLIINNSYIVIDVRELDLCVKLKNCDTINYLPERFKLDVKFYRNKKLNEILKDEHF